MVNKTHLDFSSDYLSLVLAIKIVIEMEHRLYDVEFASNKDDFFNFSTFFLSVPEFDVVTELSRFVDNGLISEVKATLFNSHNEVGESVFAKYTWNKENLKKHHITDFVKRAKVSSKTTVVPLIITLPWFNAPEFEKLVECDRYFHYEIKVNLPRFYEWIDSLLKLLHLNMFAHQAYKYERQRDLVLEDINQRLSDFAASNLCVEQFQNITHLLFPLIMYELHKDGFLKIKEVCIAADSFDKSVFLVDVLSNENSECFNSKFDRVLSVLGVGSFDLFIKKESQQYYLLGAIFDDPNKLWHFSELKDVIDGFDDLENWKKWYNVALAISNKLVVASKGKCGDFFITTTKSIQINPKYL